MEKSVQFKQTKITLTKLFFSSLSSWFYKVNINEDWHIGKTLRLRLIGSRSDQSDRDNLITLLQTSRDPIIIPRSPFLNPYIMINVLHCPTVHCLGMIIHIIPNFRVSQFVGAADTALADSITGFLEGFEGRFPSNLDRKSGYDDFRPSEKEYYAYSELPRSAFWDQISSLINYL